MVINMPTTNEYPVGNVEIGKVKIGATISAQDRYDTFFLSPDFPAYSVYNIDCKLQIIIADNSSYIDADVYETEIVDSGTTVQIEHAITTTGTYYIKMVVEDTLGSADTLEYTITAIQTLYFLNEPDVNTEGLKANSITVTSPTAEYTATTSPAPNVDELIERLIEIDEGDVVTCQATAEALIIRWGREQKSVEGNINLTVTLRFKETMHIIAPSAGINEDMPLQKKEHDVTGQITTVICGDIILSDDELLARILDEMGV